MFIYGLANNLCLSKIVPLCVLHPVMPRPLQTIGTIKWLVKEFIVHGFSYIIEISTVTKSLFLTGGNTN